MQAPATGVAPNHRASATSDGEPSVTEASSSTPREQPRQPRRRRSSLVCREATESDRDSICGDLSEGVYDGNDYLPARIDHYYRMHAAGEYRMVLCCEERESSSDSGLDLESESEEWGDVSSGAGAGVSDPVGLDVVCRYDEGETVVLQALRVKRSARGRGVAKALSSAVDEVVSTLHDPKPTTMRIITTSTNPSVGLFRKQGYVDHGRMGLCGVEILPAAATAAVAGTSSGGTAGFDPCSVDDDSCIEEVTCPSEVARRLLGIGSDDGPPSGGGGRCPYLVYDWQVERATAANAARLQERHGVRFFSIREEDGDERGNGGYGDGNGSDNGDDGDGSPLLPLKKSLSLGAPAEYVKGTKMYCTIYSSGGHLPTFEAHARHWVREALEQGRGSLATHIVFFYDREIDDDDAERIVGDALGCRRGEWIQFFRTSGGVTVMEKPL